MIKVGLIEPVGGHGGMDFYDYGLALGLGENDVKVFYYTSSETSIRSYPNVQTFLIFKKVWSTSNKLLRLFFFLKGHFVAFLDCKKRDVKVIHLQFFDFSGENLLVVFLAYFFPFKKILTLHDVSSFKSKDSGFVEKFILKNFDSFIVHNQISYLELRKKVSYKFPIDIIPHGNYLPFVDELPNKIMGETLELLFFGQIKKVKGLEVLLEALTILKSRNIIVNLSIAGKIWHDSQDKYEKLIEDLGLENQINCHFRFIKNEEVSGFFEAADIVVLPYRKIYQSGVLLLAMSYGRVVLASDLPACKEILENGVSGFLFKSEDPNSMADSIESIVIQKYNLNSIRNNASRLLKDKFDWISIGKKTKDVYKSFLF